MTDAAPLCVFCACTSAEATTSGVGISGHSAVCACIPGRRAVMVCTVALDTGRGGTANACNLASGVGVAQVVDVLGALSHTMPSLGPASAVLASADEDCGGKLGLLGVECGVGALSRAW